tara:strand:+ start:509 stop:1099 length:591 start_codon:yes stop_codon:yes gene_type:complete
MTVKKQRQISEAQLNRVNDSWEVHDEAYKIVKKAIGALSVLSHKVESYDKNMEKKHPLAEAFKYLVSGWTMGSHNQSKKRTDWNKGIDRKAKFLQNPVGDIENADKNDLKERKIDNICVRNFMNGIKDALVEAHQAHCGETWTPLPPMQNNAVKVINSKSADKWSQEEVDYVINIDKECERVAIQKSIPENQITNS